MPFNILKTSNLFAKKRYRFLLISFIFSALFGAVFSNFALAGAPGGIDATYKYAWSEKVGWINFGVASGNVIVSDGRLTGYAWSINLGWINLNPPTAGVTNDSYGILGGYAWGENLGWINFSGVVIDSQGYFIGYANGDVAGQISFNCGNTGSCGLSDFKVRTAWRPEPVNPIYKTLTISKAGTGFGTVTSSPAGINCGSDCAESYLLGTSVTLTASASTGSAFVGWSGDCSGAAPTCALTMDTDKSVTATFNALPGEERILTISKAGTGTGTVTSNPAGINCGSDCTESYLLGTSVTLTASAGAGSTFADWSGACTGVSPTCTLTMDSDKEAIATFDALPGTRWCELEEQYIPEAEWTEERCYRWCESEGLYIPPAEWSEERCVPPGTRWCELEQRYVPEEDWSEERCEPPGTRWCEAEQRYIPENEWSAERCTPLVATKWCETEQRYIPENEWTEARCIPPPTKWCEAEQRDIPASEWSEERCTPLIIEIPTEIKEIIQSVTETVKKTKEFVEKPKAQKINKTISTAGLIIGASGLLFFPLSISEWIFLLLRLLGLLMTAFGLKKRVRPWGTVYDSVTKQPLDPAYVMLQDLSGKEIASSITDLDGRYGFLVGPGHYRMSAQKTNYKFPSQKLLGKTHDELYSDLYFGEILEVRETGEVITKNIPLDPEKFDWNEFVKKKKGLLKFYSQFDLLFRRLSDLFFVVGFFAAIIAVVFVPYPYNLVIFCLYGFLLILRILGLKPKAYGSILEKETAYPLSFAIIRVFSAELEREMFQRVVDKFGRYYILVPKGKYYLKIEKKNEDGSYSHIFTSRIINAQGGIIQERFVV